jgi:15-cis-phytoene synthase
MTELEQHCMALVRTHDRDRYLASLFAPDDKRNHLLALYAFDAEVARIPGLVSEAQIGEIRLQWWVDTLEALFAGQAADHPVAQALAPLIERGHLQKQPLLNLVEARTRELYADAIPDLNAFEGYLGETRSAVLVMAAQILADGRAQGVADAAGFGGVAQGIAQLLEAKPALPHGGQHLLPALSTGDLLQHAEQRLAQYRDAAQALLPQVRPAFLPLATIGARLVKLRRKGEGHGLSPLRAQWLIWRQSKSF